MISERDIGSAGRIARFITVGIGAALLLFALIWLSAALGMSPFAGSVTAYAIAIAVAYTAQRAWTFGARHDHAHALPRYLAAQALCAFLAGAVSHVTVASLGAPPILMSAVATVTASAASFLLSSRWVFSQAARSS